MEDQTTQTEEMQSSGTVEAPKEEVIQPDKKAIRDMLKYKDAAAAAQAELAALRQEQESMERAALEEKQNYKELYERSQQEAEAAKSRLNNFTEGWKQDRKMSVIETEARAMGMDPDFVDLLPTLDHSGVIVETTDQGSVNVLGAREYLENLKATKPKMFVDSSAPKLNTTPAGGNVGQAKPLSPAELVKLQKTDPEAYKAARIRMIKQGRS